MLNFDTLICAEKIWDGGDEVGIPSGFERPSPNQMQGTAHDRLGEIACRICYDDQTEILTKQQGWILFKDLDPQNPSEVMTINPITMEAEWQIPSEVIRDPFDGELIAYDSREASLWVTPNHRHWVKLKGKETFEFVQASWLMNRKAYIPLCAKDWRGELPDQVTIPDVEYETGYKYKRGGCLKRLVKGKTFIGNQIQSLVDLMVYFAAEGFTTPKKGFVTITGHHVEEVQSLLDDLGYLSRSYTDPRNGCPFVRVVDKALCQYMDVNCGRYARNKKLPRWVLDLPKINLQRVYHVFGLTDCSKSCGFQKEPTLGSSSRTLRDNFQEILLKLGYASYSRWRDDHLLDADDDSRKIKSKSRTYRVNGKSHRFALIGGKKKLRKVTYCGEAFCVRTENGILVTRRDGKVAISGNCYDSMGVDPKTGKEKGRSSAKLHSHILEVQNHNVYEHADFTVLIKGIEHNRLMHAFINRPGVWCELVSDGFEVTLNHRCVLEWEKWETSFGEVYDYTTQGVGRQLWQHARTLAPQIYPEDRSSGEDVCNLIARTTHLLPTQASISLYLSFSRGAGNEQCRHRFRMSQRSTRFADESESPYVMHPLLTQFLSDDTVNGAVKQDALHYMRNSEAYDKSTYNHLVMYLQGYLKDRGVEGTQARKQARGAARGFLGLALHTEMVFTTTVSGWRWMLSQRGTKLADAEIRVLYATGEKSVLNCLKASRYGHFFEDFKTEDCPDGIGQSLV